MLTATKDPSHGNKKMVSISELERVYGKIRNPEDKRDSTETNGTDNNGHLLNQFLEERIQDLQAQLEKAEERETALMQEESKLLDLTDRLQKQNEVLMLPAPEETEQKSKG